MTQDSTANNSPKTTIAYWDENWRRASGQDDQPAMRDRSGYYWRRMERALLTSFAGMDTSKCRLIEIGAGASEWLPYLHSRFGFEVAGLDYSEIGCARAEANLARASVPGTITKADMFNPDPAMLNQYDVVISLGLVEHFSDTAGAVRACAAFAKPGGLIFTLIPNMSGLYGWLYSVFDREVYDIHVPLSLKDLVRAHRESGLDIVTQEHVLGLPGVIDGARQEPAFVRRVIRKTVFQASRFAWALEERGIGMPENAITSPYIICSARKPENVATAG